MGFPHSLGGCHDVGLLPSNCRQTYTYFALFAAIAMGNTVKAAYTWMAQLMTLMLYYSEQFKRNMHKIFFFFFLFFLLLLNCRRFFKCYYFGIYCSFQLKLSINWLILLIYTCWSEPFITDFCGYLYYGLHKFCQSRVLFKWNDLS